MRRRFICKALAVAMAFNMGITSLPVSAAQAETVDYVYGTVNLPYADYYYGELNSIAENATMDLAAEDPVEAAGYRESGAYDVMTSATNNKYKSMFPCTYFEELESGGGNIIGLKDVSIAVPKTLYDQAKEASENKETCNNELLDIISKMQVSEDQTAPAEYKVLNGDGTLGAMVTETVTDENATVSINTTSAYGHYGVSVTSELLPEASNLLGMIVEDEDGNKYGMEHLENLWVRTGEFSFAVKDKFVEPHGNHIDYKRHEALQGKSIRKITYLIKDGKDLVINTDLKCKLLLNDGQGAKISDKTFAAETTLPVTINAPEGSNYALASVSYAGETLTENTDYTYADQTLTIKDTEKTGVGKYTVTYVDDTYEDIITEFVLSSSYAEGSISLKDNKIVLPKGLTLADYAKNIASLTVNGENVRGSNLGSYLFLEDGSVNLAAEVPGKHGATVLFPEKEKEYVIEVTSTGYPSFQGTVSTVEKKAETPADNPSTPVVTPPTSDNTQTNTVTTTKVKLSKTKATVKSTKKKTVKISWKKVKKATGYKIQYATNKKFKKAKTVTVSSKKLSCTVKKLKSKKTYYVRVRGYYAKKGQKTVYAKWSTVKKVKVK